MAPQWSADIVLTDSLAKHLVTSQFPTLNCVHIRLLDEGWDNAVFLVNGAYVFRFPRRKIAVELLEMENRLLPWLSARVSMRMPNPQYVGIPTRDYPFTFSGYRKLEGFPPHKLTLGPDERAKIAKDLATFLRTLHNTPSDLAVEHGIVESDNIGRMDLTHFLAKFRALDTNLTILLYAHDIGDGNQVVEAQRALANTAGCI